MTELAFVVIAHRHIDAVLVLYLLLTLDEGLVLEIEPVLQKSLLQEFGDIVQGDMHEHRTDHRRGHIEPQVKGDGVDPRGHPVREKPDGQDHDEKARDQRVKDHSAGIELQLLLVPGADAGDADQKQGSDLAPDEVSVGVDEPAPHPSVNIHEDAAPEIQNGRVDGIDEELQDERDVDEAPEDLVSYDKVLTFFHGVS